MNRKARRKMYSRVSSSKNCWKTPRHFAIKRSKARKARKVAA
jgi:hypothetical protein